MSGTSLDGLDVAVVSLRGSGRSLEVIDILAFETIPLPEAEVRNPIQQLLQRPDEQVGQSHPLQLVCKLNAAWSRFAAEAVNSLLNTLNLSNTKGDVCVVIGSHGQTLWHEGHNPAPRSTLQLGDGEVLAALTETIVVSNFRTADVAVGGSGAPLVPYMDRVLSSNVIRWYRQKSSQQREGEKKQKPVVVAFQNLGGIGNVSCEFDTTAAASETSSSSATTAPSKLVAFDTGPANVILNELIERTCQQYAQHSYFQQHVWSLLPPEMAAAAAANSVCDYNGCFSSRGVVRPEWLEAWVAEHRAFIDAAPPKSTGREVFGAAFVWKHCLHLIGERKQCDDDNNGDEVVEGDDNAVMYSKNFFDLCRTAVEFTALTIVEAYQKHLAPFGDDSQVSGLFNLHEPFVAVVVLSGGGASNPMMVGRISTLLHEACDTALRETVVTTFDELRKGVLFNHEDHCKEGISWGDAKEAVAFAILAHEKLNEIAGVFSPWCPEKGEVGTNVLSATGASRGVVLGQLSIPTV